MQKRGTQEKMVNVYICLNPTIIILTINGVTPQLKGRDYQNEEKKQGSPCAAYKRTILNIKTHIV